jgi:predicted glycogen debranching enzyme
MSSTVELKRNQCSVEGAMGLEWLVTNGLGGYAAGSVAGANTRRYHGILVAALRPPLGRTVLVQKVEETVEVCDGDRAERYELSTNRWADGSLAPTGFRFCERFELDGAIPTWTFTLGTTVLQKQIWMEHGAPTTYVRYRVVRAPVVCRLALAVLVNHRGFHATTSAGDWRMNVNAIAGGVEVRAFDGAPSLLLRAERGDWRTEHNWHRGIHLEREQERGLDSLDDALRAATLCAELLEGDTLTLCSSLDSEADTSGSNALVRRRAYELDLLECAGLPDNGELRQLVLAADQFVVERATRSDDQGRTIIAGYPWFGDWGRDTMIALPGLTLSTGRPMVARSILRTFAQHVDQGMLPNRFVEDELDAEYNTVDATLWYFEALRQYVEHTDDRALVGELWPVLESIVQHHLEGTRYGIGMDPADHLLAAGEAGVQLTWMDAKVGDWVITPRIGKPVEVNALWFNALRTMEGLARLTSAPSEPFAVLAERVALGFERFWNAERGCCFDVVDGPDGHDPSIRPNQLFAASLAHSPLSEDRQRAIVDACARDLYTPRGLRSLGPREPDYTTRYVGAPAERDAVYHQGTVWGWLLGPFALAHFRAYGDKERARAFLEPLLAQLHEHGIGSISEIFDGDAPFTARGCIAQAWSVAEVLRAWRLLC